MTLVRHRSKSEQVFALRPSSLLKSGSIRRQVACSPDGSLGAVLGVDLSQNRFNVNLDGGFGNVELTGDQLVGVALHQAAENDGFANRQAFRSRPIPGLAAFSHLLLGLIPIDLQASAADELKDGGW